MSVLSADSRATILSPTDEDLPGPKLRRILMTLLGSYPSHQPDCASFGGNPEVCWQFAPPASHEIEGKRASDNELRDSSTFTVGPSQQSEQRQEW